MKKKVTEREGQTEIYKETKSVVDRRIIYIKKVREMDSTQY
jgi:hypothetical protein